LVLRLVLLLRAALRVVDKDQLAWPAAHPGLALLDPDTALLGHVSACALRCHQLFFYT
jgi:hypothetical protein